MTTETIARRPLLLAAAALILLLVGVAAGWLWHSHGSLAGGDRAEVERVVREYILANPEILPEAMANLQKKEAAKQVASVRGPVHAPFPGAVLGNPNGKVTLVEFTDYACGYCRQSVDDVAALVAATPDLRVIIREMPILSPQSHEAARWALAAAEQGKYAAFHRALFAAGQPNDGAIQAAAKTAGLDMARAERAIEDPNVAAELDRNIDLARQLGFSGTPSWVIGDRTLSGALGREALAEAIEDARG